MTRTLIVPAAGLGSRLGATTPKILVPVSGRPMIDHLLSLYGGAVNHFVVVVSPAGRDPVEAFVRQRSESVSVAVQPHPTGMLDAILAPFEEVWRYQPDRVWVTWCDQLAVHPRTVARLLEAETAEQPADMVLPTVVAPGPSIHFERSADGRIVGVRQSREGDDMPAAGETDIGLYSLSKRAYLRDLKSYADAPSHEASPRERNFLPFIPWLAASRPVVTIPCVHTDEAAGISSEEDLRRLEAHLRDADRDNG